MNETNVLVFQIEATLKATTLGIRMCSTKLLLWKNRKGSTRYPMSLYKRDSTVDIFLGIFNYFFRANNFTKQLQTTDCKGFYLLRLSHDYYFRRAEQGQLSQCNRRTLF